MARSRSRSPRWKHRSLSPTRRSPENYRPRPFDDHYGGEFRGNRRGTRRPMHWREEERNYSPEHGRFPPHENVHHRPYIPRPPSPNLRRTPPFDNVDRYKPYRNLSPQRGLGNRRYPYPPHPPRHPEEDSYKEHEWNFHQQKPQGRYMGEQSRPYRGGRGGRPFRGHFAGPFQRDERWHENDNFRHPRMQQPHRRSPEDFGMRNSFNKRYSEDREFKEYGPIPKRAREMERHENRDPGRPANWKPDHSPPADKWGPRQRHLGPRAQQSMERENAEGPAVSKVPFSYSRKYPDGKQAFDGQVQKSARLEVRKYKSPTVPLPVKELDCYSDNRVKPPGERPQKTPPKSNSKKGHKEDGDLRPVSSKSKERVKKEDGEARPVTGKPKEKVRKEDGDAKPVTSKTKERVRKEDGDAKPVTSKTKERVRKEDGDVRPVTSKIKERVRKEGDTAEDPDSTTSTHEQSPMSSELKTSANCSPKLKMITVQVDMKKTVDKYRLSSGSITERQTSQDLFAVANKKEDFHPVFEHIDSETQSGPNSPKTEFTQEVIIITHQVKANYFKSSELTLHERFSKLKDKDVEDVSEVTVRSDPEIHRRIDISLEDLQNKCANKSVSEQISSGGSFIKGKTIVKVIENPRDLRHDIERRRKKRLLSGDDRAFSPDTSGRDKGESSFSRPCNSKPEEFRKPARFMRPPFRNNIGRFHMSSYHSWKTNDHFTGRRQYGSYFENTRGIRRPFKRNFTDGRFQPQFKSGLVQKGMYIQAKYQRFRTTGRGFTTNNYRERFLRKEVLALKAVPLALNISFCEHQPTWRSRFPFVKTSQHYHRTDNGTGFSHRGMKTFT